VELDESWSARKDPPLLPSYDGVKEKSGGYNAYVSIAKLQ
jgi:hypothetical protein